MTKQLIVGMVIGIIVPILGITLILTIMTPNVTMEQVLSKFWMNTAMSATISLALLFNLALFFLLDKFNREMMSRGIIAGTIIWGFYVLILLMQN